MSATGYPPLKPAGRRTVTSLVKGVRLVQAYVSGPGLLSLQLRVPMLRACVMSQDIGNTSASIDR
jgi:hypothetical protein